MTNRIDDHLEVQEIDEMEYTQERPEGAETQCGFVAILGAPNAGKSTLVNQLTGMKVSIVSPKVQTTRQQILGISLIDNCQLILVDTPGIIATPERRLERSMVHAAWGACRDADVLCVMADVHDISAHPSSMAAVKAIFDHLKKRPFILVLNKIDTVKREVLLGIVADLRQYSSISDIFMISALTGDGVPDLHQYLAKQMKPGPWLYPEDQICNLPERLWAAEITREQLYHQLQDELPYETMVETESWEEFQNGSVKINQVITVCRESQKAIVLGKGGQRIKSISATARHELAELLGRPVHLFLFVKVVEDWINKREAYRNMGLEFDIS